MSQRAHVSSVLDFGLLVIVTSSLCWGASDSALSRGNIPSVQPAAAGPRRSFCVNSKNPSWILGTDGFARFELGHPVAEWFPVDLHGDGTWKLAILTAETPARVGVLDPSRATWIDGPRPVSVLRGGWGVGDWNADGRLEYCYLSADSIRCLDTRTSVDAVLWRADFPPVGMFVWGRTSGGGPAVALKKSGGSYPNSGGRYWWKVYDLLTGAAVKSLDGGVSSLRLIAGYPGVPHGDVAVLHESHSTFDHTPMTGLNYYLQSLWLLDEEWNVFWGAELPWASENDVPKPPWALASVDYLPPSTSSGGGLFWLTESAMWYFPTYPLNSWMGCLTETDYTWLNAYYDYSGRMYAAMVTYDFRVAGCPETILPLWHTPGWELRDVNTGAIIDTIPNMPKADLRTGPLLAPTQRDLFYVADSGLYIWGIDTLPPPDRDSGGTATSDLQLAVSPNPFATTVRLDWSSAPGASALEIFNILGQRVRTYDLSDAGRQSSVEWDSRDNSGRTVPSGIYFARIAGLKSSPTTKLVLLK